MVASSPVRHDSPIGVHPLEVQPYQPPWKALSDFALHADLEQPHQPAFQQLVNQVSMLYRFAHVLTDIANQHLINYYIFFLSL